MSRKEIQPQDLQEEAKVDQSLQPDQDGAELEGAASGDKLIGLLEIAGITVKKLAAEPEGAEKYLVDDETDEVLSRPYQGFELVGHECWEQGQIIVGLTDSQKVILWPAASVFGMYFEESERFDEIEYRPDLDQLVVSQDGQLFMVDFLGRKLHQTGCDQIERENGTYWCYQNSDKKKLS